MLEIVLLYFICKNIGKILRDKGRHPLALQIMTVILWFGGEFTAGIIMGIMAAMEGREFDGFDITVYVFAIAGAAIGVGIAYAIAFAIPPKETPQSAYGGPSSPTDFSNIPPSSNPYNPYDVGGSKGEH